MNINTEEDFIDLVRRSETDALNNPRLYTAKLALFALLGYLVIFGVLISLIGLVAGLSVAAFFSTGALLFLVKSKLIIAVFPVVWLLLRALWLKFEPPQGYRLERSEYPILFAELDELSQRLNALKIHHVILDDSLNAAVIQHPRLGVLGWHKNYLILGYQFMLMLSPEEMRSVLAHEFGHLSKNHCRFGGWIYRVRMIWARIMDAFDQDDSPGTVLMRRFFNWYSPQFEAYSFALARNNEYEADAVSAALTSPEIATRALVSAYTTSPYLEDKYWNTYYGSADDNPEPRYAPFAGLVDFLKENRFEAAEMMERIKSEMAVETHYADTHPCLKDRVVALGALPQMPSRAMVNAAEAWLEAGNHDIVRAFDRKWFDDHRESWKDRYDYVQEARRRLQKFTDLKAEALNDDELWEYACITHEFISSDAAFALYEAYHARHPEDPDSSYYLGQKLLEQDDDTALDYLRIAGNNPYLVEEIAHTGYHYLKTKGKEQEANDWWQASIRQNDIHLKASIERENVDIYDRFMPPEINDELLQQFVTQLQQHDEVDKAWLARKLVHYHTHSPVYVIAFSTKKFPRFCSRRQSRLAQQLTLEANVLVVCISGRTKELAGMIIDAGTRIV